MPSVRYGSGDVSPEPLAQPLSLYPSGKTAKNRFMKGPMAETLASWDVDTPSKRGMPNQNLVELYRRWGENNWGVIVTGNVCISNEQMVGVGVTVISTEDAPEGEKFELFKEIATVSKASGSLVIGQVNHPGRQVDARMVPESISASDVQLPDNMGASFAKPHAATKDEIAQIVQGFVHAAGYLEKAGFDGIELHAAHGYLISQFLSRTTNLRTDEYGVQNTENRLRFISDIVHAIKARVSSSFIISAKLNSVEFQDGGVTPQEAQEVCRLLEKLGLDYVELSGGTYENLGLKWEKESTRKREAYFLEFASSIAEAMGPDSKMRLFIAGGLRSVGAMVGALNVVDGVSLSRPAAAEPDLAQLILEGKVPGALRSVEGFENDVMKELMVAQSQINQMARGLRPMNHSDAETMETFGKNLGEFFQLKMAEGDKLVVEGAVEYSGKLELYNA